MPRPSLKKERTDQILDALEHCLAEGGLEAATQDRIAEAAGLARPLLRHNVGNRDEMFRLGLARFMARSDKELSALFAALPGEDRAETLVASLLETRYFDARAVRVLEGFSAWTLDQEGEGQAIVAWTEQFIEALAGQFSLAMPAAESSQLLAVATCLSGLYFQLASLAPLGDATALQAQSLDAARQLLASLQ